MLVSPLTTLSPSLIRERFRACGPFFEELHEALASFQARYRGCPLVPEKRDGGLDPDELAQLR